jgi:flagellar motor protein MotB
MRSLSLFIVLVTLLAASCVPQQQYAELEQTLSYYKGEALATDSIRGVNLKLQTDNNETQADYQSLTRELERLTATNISLNRNYQDIVNRYNNTVGENQRVLAATSYETTNLEQELALRQDDLDKKERSLAQMETQMRDRDAELQRLEASGANRPAGYDAVPDARLQQLRNQKAALNQQRTVLISYFQRVLVGFPTDEVAIAATDEGVTLTLSQALLFAQGNDGTVYWKGRQGLQQIAVVLRDNPSLKVDVIGHANPTSNTKADWALSTTRALAVASELNAFGVDAGRLTAAGRGGNQPLVSATNSQAQILNGRTVIVVRLDYLAILQALD